MLVEGNIQKMEAENQNPVTYFLPVGAEKIEMNLLIGKSVKFEFSGQINCKKCQRKTKNSFGQGFCYPCFISAPEAEECVLKPELCQAHLGIARDMDFAREHCLVDHFVYLANTGSVKVGVTRHMQIPTRWIDQGATSAIIVAKTPNRYLAGMIEVELKKYFPDKTNWRLMLSGIQQEYILENEKQRAIKSLPDEYKSYVYTDNNLVSINYPVIKYPERIKSFDFEKDALLSGILNGIKGQYLIFENGMVVNVRKFEGYYLKISI